MIDYQTYVSMGGKATEENFNALLPIVATQFLNYVSTKIPYWRLDYYDPDAQELYSAFVTQIDNLDANNFIDTRFDDMSGIASIQTDGFTIGYGTQTTNSGYQPSTQQMAASQLYVDVRLSIDTYLRKRGLMFRGFYGV